MFTEPNKYLAQVRIDFENAKKRLMLAQQLKAQGMSEAEIMRILEDSKQPDIVDVVLNELEEAEAHEMRSGTDRLPQSVIVSSLDFWGRKTRR